MSFNELNSVHQTVHGYSRGHGLLAASLSLSLDDSDCIAQLSDLSGLPMQAEVPSYISCYPLPSREFYAVARTWPDYSAPRDGCVLTHTILVPMNVWRSEVSASRMFQLFSKPERSDLGRFSSPIRIRDGREIANVLRLTPDDEDKLSRLILQYFGYGKSPIVWFGDGDSHAPILSSLLDYLWPSLRSEFSACTYALQVMSFRKRVFDLMFAPRSAVSRFSRLPDSQLVGYSKSVDRSRLEERYSKLINVVRAGLMGEEFPGVKLRNLKPFLPPDPSALLKILVLEELEDRSHNSAAAAVAMLDVLATLAPRSGDALSEKSEVLAMVIDRVRGEPSAAAIELLSAIGQRCSKPAFRSLKGFRRDVRLSIADHTSRDPYAALSLVGKTVKLNGPTIAGIAEGLQRSNASYIEALHSLSIYSPKHMDALLAYAPSLAVHYLTQARAGGWGAAVDDVILWQNRALQRVRMRLVDALIASGILSQDERLLEGVLTHIMPKQVGALFRTVRPTAEFMPQLSWLSRSYPAESRAALVAFSDRTPAVAVLLASTFEASEEGLSRLDDSYGGNICFDIWVTAAFFGRSDVWENIRPVVLRRSGFWIGKLLSAECETSEVRFAIVRLLEEGRPLDLVDYVELGGTLENTEVFRLLSYQLFLSASFKFWTGGIDEATLMRWIEAGSKQRLFNDRMASGLVGLIDRMVETKETSRLLWRWLEALSDSAMPPIEAITTLARPIFEKSKAHWADEATTSWCAIIGNARRATRNTSLVTLEKQAFELSLRNVELPLSRVIVLTFPGIYSSATSNSNQKFYEFFFIFPDWDKGKELRRKLVEVFFHSQWPPGDLAVTADSAGILEKILSRVLRTGPPLYLEAIVFDLESRGSSSLASKVKDSLRHRKIEDWD